MESYQIWGLVFTAVLLVGGVIVAIAAALKKGEITGPTAATVSALVFSSVLMYGIATGTAVTVPGGGGVGKALSALAEQSKQLTATVDMLVKQQQREHDDKDAEASSRGSHFVH